MGQLGSELQKQLREGRCSLGAIPKEYQDAKVVGVDIDTIDISDSPEISKYIIQNNFDIIFNCAAYTDVDGCEANKELAYRVNSDAPGYIAEAAKVVSAKVIHISTDYVFSGDEETPRTEDDEPGPKTVYGKSKLYGEERVLANNPNSIVVRTAWLYGLNGKNFPKTIMSAARERGSVKVVDDQTGNPTNAVDLAYHLLRLAVTDLSGVFHCTNNGICSWYDFTKEIIKEAGITASVSPCTTEEFPRPAPRPHFSALENKRLKETIGDQMRQWQDAIKEYIYDLANQ